VQIRASGADQLPELAVQKVAPHAPTSTVLRVP
jgi:hypothetical protein